MLHEEKMMGVLTFTKAKKEGPKFTEPPRYFRRFEIGPDDDDDWNLSDETWDAVTFIPNRNVLIVGAGIFESCPAD